jgi:hypothetical protein
MKKNIKNYILLLLHFFYIYYFIYSNKDTGNECYTKLLSFLSFEILGVSIFFIFKKDILFNSVKIFLSLLSFFIIIFLNYFGITYLEISITIIMLIELPIILYLFIIFLVEEKFIYFLYTILNLFLFTIILNTYNFNIEDNLLKLLILKIFITYGILTFIYFILLIEIKKNKIMNNFMKKNVVFLIFHFLFIILLIYKSKNFGSPYYEEVIVFISFELFGIIVFYDLKKYIKNLNVKIGLFFLFWSLIIESFKYFNKIIIESLLMCIALETILLILILFVYSITKRSKFHLGYALIELLWYIIFIFFNLISSIPELSGLELHILHILLAYIIVSYLYVSLLKKNESKRIEKYKNKESE